MKRSLLGMALLLVSIAAGFSADAGSVMFASSDSNSDSSPDSAFRRGQWEVGVCSGALFSPIISRPNRNVVNFSLTEVQLGYMLTNPNHGGWYRGNFELLGGVFCGTPFTGRGSYIGGGTLWLRYNFLPVNWPIKPYAQIGAGSELTDFDHRMLGQDFNFNVDGALGLRYLIGSRCSVNLEYRYEHYSDAYLTRRNLGINAQGIMVGISWLF